MIQATEPPFGTRAGKGSRWKQFESTDLALYAANLRAAGCPEKTVRDILLPFIEERFQVPSTLSAPTNFWASFSQRRASEMARAEQERVRGLERDKLLNEVLGFAWTSEGLRQTYAGETAGSIGFLDYGHAEKFLCITDRLKTQFLRADRSHRPAIYQEWRQEVADVLSPIECDETELREILTIYQRPNPNLSKAGLSGSELRQLMAFRRELCNPLPSAALAGADEPVQDFDWFAEQQFNSKTRSLLGESRFIDYLQNCDASMDRILAAVDKEHLPRSLALQLFDLRHEAMARAEEIRQLPVHRAEKRARLAAVRQSAFQQLAALPSGLTDNVILRINQDWLQEIANP